MCPLWAKSRHRLFDHLVGASEERRRHREAKCLGRFEIDHQLVLGWLLHRQVGWLLALEDTIDIRGAAPPQVGIVNSVGNQASARHKEAVGVHGRQFRTRSQTYDKFTVHSARRRRGLPIKCKPVSASGTWPTSASALQMSA